MLAFVPVTFDLYRSVRRHLHWTLQNLIAFADRDGRCFPSVRTLAGVTGQPRSTVSRHLAQLAQAGLIKRQRRPGGCYAYVIDGRFLPAKRGVSHSRAGGVPLARREEQVGKERGRFAQFGREVGDAPWTQRLAGWRKRGFWLAAWGPKPGEAGCFAPLAG